MELEKPICMILLFKFNMQTMKQLTLVEFHTVLEVLSLIKKTINLQLLSMDIQFMPKVQIMCQWICFTLV